MKTVLLLPSFLFFLFFQNIHAQDLFPEPGPVFDDSVIPRIDIVIPQDSLDLMLENVESNYHWHATFIFDNGTIKDTIENIGFRLRGNTSRYSEKKSFKISFNTYEPGRKYYGLEKMNINGEHNDPSISRSKICWDMLRNMEVAAPRSNHVEFYVNDTYVGLFINVEHIDEEFVQLRFGNNDGNLYKCLYPADLNYKGDDPDLYKEVFNGRRAYSLRTNVEDDDYSDLANFIDILNNTPIDGLPCELENVFNVNTYLKAIAFDILSGNWDGPIFNQNNFYLYKNEATGKFEYIPYDVDNTIGIDFFGIDWSTRNIYEWGPENGYRPIYERLLEVPEWRNRFSYYMDKFVETIFNEDALFPYLDDLREKIGPSVVNDPLYPLDYGFTFEDFEDSFDSELPYFHVPISIEEYITERRSSVLSQLENYSISPIITDIENNYPNEDTDISITAKVEDDENISAVEACYQIDGGSITCVEMFDNGMSGDGSAEDGIYGVNISAIGTPGVVDYYIKSSDNSSQESQSPICGTNKIYIGSSNVALVINEIMASNETTIADENGEYDDWIEIFSLSDAPIYLGNYFLSDDEETPDKWQMPDAWIQPGEYLVFWTDDDDGQGDFHTNFKLSAGGEYIGIFESEANNFALIDGFEFDEQFTDIAIGRLPNGTGNFQLVNATPGAINEAYTSSKEINELDIVINVSPNPFSDILHIYSDETVPENMELKIYDAAGKVVFQNRVEKNKKDIFIRTNGYSSGVYTLQIKGKNGKMAAYKIIKN